MNKLPLWRLTEGLPAYNDVESATALEQTYKVYKAMNELVDEYNKFSANLEKHMNDYINSTTKDLEAFKIGLRQEFQDFIDVVDVKIDAMETTILAECTEEMNRYVQNEIKQMIHDLGQQEIDEIYDNFATEVETIKTDYLTKEEAGNTYAKNTDLTALEERVGTLEEIGVDPDGNTIDLSAYLTKTEASNLYATKSDLTLLQNQVNTLSASITALEARIAELEENGTSGGNDNTGTGDSGTTDPVEPEEPETITDLTGTTWIWNEPVAIDSADSGTFDINFSSAPPFTWIELIIDGTNNTLSYVNSESNENVSAYTGTNWDDNAFKTISITGGTDATNTDLIALLSKYATKQ